MNAMESTVTGDMLAEFAARGVTVEITTVIGRLLKHVGSVKLEAVPRFVVADNFKKGNVVGGREIGWVGDNFHEHFDEVVENVPAQVVHIWELITNSLDGPIINIFGDPDSPRTETFLGHTFQLMGLGEKGFGLLNGYANFGYKLSQKDGNLWVPDW